MWSCAKLAGQDSARGGHGSPRAGRPARGCAPRDCPCRDAKAQAGFLRALAGDPQLTHAQVRLAVIAIERGRAVDAAPLLNVASAQAISSPTLRAQICFVRGMAQFHVGQEGAALVSMDDAIRLEPLSPFPHQWKAAICALRGTTISMMATSAVVLVWPTPRRRMSFPARVSSRATCAMCRS